MIPNFPEFKKLELADKNEIESITKRFPPYSDFNFISMFSWDIKGDMRVSFLNKNLVVRFNDYITGKPFYSFLGDNMVNETAKELIEYSRTFGGGDELRLVPEVVVEKINKENFKVVEDRDHFDYIISTELFREYNTKKTRTKSNAVKKFLREVVSETRLLNLSENEIKNQILNLFDKWSEEKEDPLGVQNELKAIKKYLNNVSYYLNDIALGIFLDDKMIGFCITEILNKNYANIHFCKADTSISTGLYAYVLKENARIVTSKGCLYINIEQDLGIESLRKWKLSHGSDIFLKKYSINY